MEHKYLKVSTDGGKSWVELKDIPETDRYLNNLSFTAVVKVQSGARPPEPESKLTTGSICANSAPWLVFLKMDCSIGVGGSSLLKTLRSAKR